MRWVFRVLAQPVRDTGRYEFSRKEPCLMPRARTDRTIAPRPFLIASIVATAFFMEGFDSTVIVSALPHMARAFDTTPVSLSLGLTAYILALAVTLPASGWIADRYGARTVFASAIVLFALTSVLCGFALSLPQFAAARALQGFSGALMSPVGRLVVLRLAEKKDFVRVMNFVSVPGLVGPLLGPPIGGFIATYADWRWIFFLNVPVAALGATLVLRFIPDLHGERRSFDLAGFCLNGVALACLLLGLDMLGQGGLNSLLGAGLSALGFSAGWAAMRHYQRAEKPLIDLSALRIKTFATATLMGGSLFRMSMAAPIFVLPLFLQVGLGHSAFVSGLLILAHSAGDLGVKVITTATLKRFGFRSVLIASAAAFGALMAGLALVGPATPLWAILVVLLVSGAVRSLQMTSLSSMQFADVPRDQMTGASTYASVNQNVTRAIGIAVAALILNIASAFTDGGGASVASFHIAFIATGLLSFAAMYRYMTLPLDAGRHVSEGR